MADVGGASGYNSDVKIGEVKDKNDTTKVMDNNSEICNLPETEKSITDESKKLTKKDRIKNTIIGAGLGIAAAGTIIIVIGTGASLYAGSATATIGLFGLTGIQTVAAGALAYNVLPILVAPFVGLELETLELK